MPAKTVQLENGVTYRGRILVFSPMGLGVTEEKVKDGFTSAGFKDAKAWLDESDLPADWPPEARADVASAENTQAWVEGTWDKPSGQYPGGGSKWELYDYWPKDNAKPVQVGNTPGTPMWVYGAVAGGVAVVAILLIASTSKE